MQIKYIGILCLLLLTVKGWSQSFSRTPNGIKIRINSTEIELQVYAAAMVRVLKYPEGSHPAKKSFSVTATPAGTPFSLKEEDGALMLTTKELTVRLNLKTGIIHYFDAAGRLLLSEQDGGTGRVKEQEHDTYQVGQDFQVPAGEALYGLGQHQEGIMNYRNHSVTIRQRNMEIAVPFILSSAGYGIFWDNYSETTFSDRKNGTSFESVAGTCIDYYFMNGHHADGVISDLRALTGQAPMFPKWVFGFWQSRERYRSRRELLDVVKKYRELKVPLDGIVQDWQYWGEGDEVWNSTEFGNPLFPEPAGMMDSVHRMNTHMIISVWPNFGKNTNIYRELDAKGFLYGFKTWPESPSVKVYDAFNPAARDIYWKHMNKNLFSAGIDGWWLDATEPEQQNAAQSDSARTFEGSFKFVRNAYPLVTTGGVYQNQRKTNPGKRVFILTRSAFAGQQRNATMTWSGDIQGTWDVFRKQISGGLNLSLSGIPYWNTDIGGFFTSEKYPKGVNDPAFHEIYTRWLEFAAFTPMFRSHGTSTPREIYQFGKKGDWAFNAQEKFINLRYRFLPYIYSAAWQVTNHSSTMMRALVMDFAADSNVYSINNQYMFGKSVLVSPVTDSMYTERVKGETLTDFSKIKSIKVYLPKGAGWTDFWSGKTFAGGNVVNCEAPIDQIPLFIRSGSVLPLGPFQQYTSAKTPDTLEIRVYPGADGRFLLYEDETDNYNYEKGIYSTIEMVWNDGKRALTIQDRKGSFPGMPVKRLFNVVLVNSTAGTGIEPSSKNNKKVNYSGKKLEVVL